MSGRYRPGARELVPLRRTLQDLPPGSEHARQASRVAFEGVRPALSGEIRLRRLAEAVVLGVRRDGHPRRRVGPVRGVREQRLGGHVGVGLRVLPPAPSRDGRPDERRVDPEGARLGRQPGRRRGRGRDHVDAPGRGRHHGLRRGPRGPDRDTHAPALDLAGRPVVRGRAPYGELDVREQARDIQAGVPGAPRGVPRQVLRGAMRDAPRVRRDAAPPRRPGGGAVPP
mmetsp:Transcript_6238/g.14384  ORF Transcript_6238/g.14384 Transcript_6238/m.14384 type:complete len:227 (+) Transcript_6238:513-1193(+)